MTSLSFGLQCLSWEFSSPQCSRDGGRTSTVALLDSKIAVLREAKIFDLIMQKVITRMPNIPTANYDDNPETIEISSSEDEEEVEAEEPEDGPSSPTARGTRMEQTSGETDAGVDDIEVDDDDVEDMGGQPSEAKKCRTEVRGLRDQFEKIVADASNARYCPVCGGDHNLDECKAHDNETVIDAIMRMRLMMEQKSKSPSSCMRLVIEKKVDLTS